jgi:hypothetical protein
VKKSEKKRMTFFYPEYDKRQTLYWVVWVFILLNVIGVGIYLGFFVHNVAFLHTWFANPSTPGDMLVSFRNGFASVSVRISVFSQVLSLFFIMTMLAFRKIYGCNIIWFALYIVCVCLSLVTLAALSGAYAHCNGQNQFGNVCNDRKWCCVPEIYSNLANKCPNTLPCDPPVTLDDLRANSDFLGLYWMHFILLVFQAFFVGLTVYVIYKQQYHPPAKETEEEMEEEQPPIKYPPPVLNGKKMVIKKAHGLRQRNN